MRHFFRRRHHRNASNHESVDELTRRNVETIDRIEREAELKRPLADRLADFIALTIGSWRFVILQTSILVLYTLLNVIGWVKHWDPYPFILLNLLLNIQAAYTGPIIMMSQNRQSKLDERRNRLDLQINLLAEQENTEMLRLLRKLCEKADIPVDEQRSMKGLEQHIRPEALLRQIERAMEERTGSDSSVPFPKSDR